MASIAKITGSEVSATNENTLALANFNVDFSLVKVEVPVEYQELRSALSRRRIENAEQGPQHRTARRLGALFEQILPSIKTLSEAYGRRASEIVQSGKWKCQGSAHEGPFAQHVGFYETSIYAAATSGTSAIAVHLLACLLARTWSGPEATAIWVELIAERKRETNETMDASQIQGLAAHVAAEQEIFRTDVETWDASARAWLLSADEVQSFNSTQLRLIIKDCGLLVSSLGNTYDSVIDVWVTAMRTLQDLILGRPQRVSKGALLVGLLSWHIYPDLNVVGPLVYVHFNDDLVTEGGIVTIGPQNATLDDGVDVQWSLSLSHLRYYGSPVTVSTSAGANASRITMDDLYIIALGAVFGTWGDCLSDPCTGAELVITIKSSPGFHEEEKLEAQSPSLYVLWSAARRLLDSSQVERERFLCLLAFGRRRAKLLLMNSNYPQETAFGLASGQSLWKVLSMSQRQDLSSDEEIERLRRYAEMCGLLSAECVICYRQAKITTDTKSSSWQYVYTTAIPFVKRLHKRSPDGTPKEISGHASWPIGLLRLKEDVLKAYCVTDDSKPVDQASAHDLEEKATKFRWQQPPELFQDPSMLHETGVHAIVFRQFVGNSSKPRLFVRASRLPTELRDCLLSFDSLAHETEETREYQIKNNALGRSLTNLARAGSIYRRLPGATIALSIVNTPLYGLSYFARLFSSLPAKIACFALFEAGSNDIQPEQLESVMAMSSGNSMYVASALLQDPIEPNSYGPQGIVRIVGNIDRPGIVMLAPPQAPLIKQEDLNCWRFINHDGFDGRLDNCFPETSLHLSFTEYEVPLSVPIGAVDASVRMMKTLISVHDRKNWVADLDIVASLKDHDLFKRLLPPRCIHTTCDPKPPMENAAIQIGKVSGKRLISITSWEELLNHPLDVGFSKLGVVQAYDNWHARVATMSVSVQMRLRTVVLPSKPLCTICGADIFINMADFADMLIV